ncbi:MAG TPA: OstA-like protein, partial [Acidobacteriota bacterium]|nr:OstA-like protein [Acidobacteriota bacterium]
MLRNQNRIQSWRLVVWCALPAMLCLWSSPAGAQRTVESLLLDHADSTELIRTSGATQYHLYGNVGFTQGDTRLASDRAVWIPDDGLIEFTGNVGIRQPGRLLLADRVVYRRDNRSVFAYGNVLVEDTTERFS